MKTAPYKLIAKFSDGDKFTLDYPTEIYENESDLFGNMEFALTEGNFSCDCNRRLSLDREHSRTVKDVDDYECGHELILSELTAIRPDGTQVKLNHG